MLEPKSTFRIIIFINAYFNNSVLQDKNLGGRNCISYSHCNNLIPKEPLNKFI